VRDHLARCSRRESHEKLVRAEGLEPSRTMRSNGFSCHYGFRRPRLIAARFGVWTICGSRKFQVGEDNYPSPIYPGLDYESGAPHRAVDQLLQDQFDSHLSPLRTPPAACLGSQGTRYHYD